MSSATKITTPDNGYFAIATRPCGHNFRINTEYNQWARRTDRARYNKLIAADIAKRDQQPCNKCAAAI